MDEGRPIPLLVAVVVLGLIGIGGLSAAPFLAAEASVAGRVDDHLGGMGGAALLGAAGGGVVVGVLGVVGAVGLWRRRGWGWVAAVVVTALVICGTILAIAVGVQERSVVLGLGLGIAGAFTAWLPATREACTR